MKKFIETLRNIWKINELRNRILYTFGMLFVFVLGTNIQLPGIDTELLELNTQDQSSILGLINGFTGGAFKKAAIFALGIMPYISASIIVQLLGFAVPYFQKLQKTEGEAGRKKLNQITRLLTVAITLFQGAGYLAYMSSSFTPDVPWTVIWITDMIILSTGTIFAMWLGERITEKGIGNGISLLITVGIINQLPIAFTGEVTSKIGTNPLGLFLEIIILFGIIMATVMLVQGVRKIPIQFAKRMVGRSGSSTLPQAGKRDYIPLKVNASGVMPIIFAQALMFVPMAVLQFTNKSGEQPDSSSFLFQLTDFTSIPYNIVYFIMVVLFTFVYTALVVNPQQYTEHLKRQNAFIPGIKPGKNTENYIDSIVSKITLPGAVFLGIISILPAAAAAFGVQQSFALFFGGTSLLIIVGVVLDTLQQVESHLLMRKYDGLVKSGKIKGRTSSMPTIGQSM